MASSVCLPLSLSFSFKLSPSHFLLFVCAVACFGQHLPGPARAALTAFVIALHADKAKTFSKLLPAESVSPLLSLSLSLSLVTFSSLSLSLIVPHFKCPFVPLYTCHALIFPSPPLALHSLQRAQHCGRLMWRIRNVLHAACHVQCAARLAQTQLTIKTQP